MAHDGENLKANLLVEQNMFKMTNSRWALSLITLALLSQQVHSINGGAHSPLLKRQTRQQDSNCTGRELQQNECRLKLTIVTTTTPKPAPKTTTSTTQKPGLITRTSDAIYKTLSDLFKPDGEQDEELISVVTPKMPTGGRLPEFGRRNASKPTSQTTTTTTTTKWPNKIARSQQPHVELDLYRDEPMTTRLPLPRSTTRRPIAIKSTSTTAAPTTTTTMSSPTSTREATNVIRTSTTKPPHISPEKILDANQNKPIQRDTKLFGIINSALNSIYSLSEFTYLNRTTRLAHGHESIDIQAAGQEDEVEPKEAARLIALESSQTQIEPQYNNSRQFATREDIHLLCKLLHKQLENGFALPNGNLNSIGNRTQVNDQQATTTGKPSTIIKNVLEQPVESQPNKPRGLFISNLNELNEAQESRLLESTFALNKSRSSPGQSFNESHEETSQRLLLGLFNFARRIQQNSSRGESLETSDDDNVLYSNSTSSNDHFLGLKLWSKSIYGGKGGRLRLVYWLIEPIFRNLTRGDGGRGPLELYKFKVVDSGEANELLDLLDHSLIKRQLDAIQLVPVGGLVRPHKASSSIGQEDDENNLNVVDDNLASVSNSNEQPPQASKKSGLQRLADRLTNQSFADNLYLYLLMLLILVFLVVLCCFGCPIFCCKRKQSPQDLDHLRQSISSISGALKSPASPTLQQHQQRQLAKNKRHHQEEQLKQASDAIWRKLSNSTTTLVTDQTRVLRHDGSIEVPILKERADETSGDHLQPSSSGGGGGGGQFEWYSFEDHRSEEIQRRRRPGRSNNSDQNGHHQQPQTSDKQSQTFIISDRRQLTKSVQTYAEAADGGAAELSADQSSRLMMSCRDRHEAKSSDTLTKSELIMLKEKLIPIEAQVQSGSGSGKQQVGSQTSIQRPDDYVNMTTQTGASIDDQQAPPVARSANYVEQRATRYIDSSSSSSDRPSTVIDQLVGQQQHAGASCSLGATTLTSGTKSTLTGAGQPPYQSMGLERDQLEREQLERRPKMRHLELPPKYGSKVEAIKSELNKLELRDSGSTGTYKRYDVI